MDREKLILEIMADAEKEGDPLTREEAEQVAEWEIRAKGCKVYAQADKPKKEKLPKVVQVSEEKIALFDLLWEGLSNFYGENAQIVKNNKEISVQIGQKSFKIDLIEHRNKQK